MAWLVLLLVFYNLRRDVSIRVVACLLWLTVVGVGFAYLGEYQNTVGTAGQTPSQWPSAAQISLDQSRPTLLMFAHPQCPCTRASVEELNRLMARCSGKATVHVLFFKPAGFADDWTKAGLWQSAVAIPGVSVQADPDAKEAGLFGAETSGYVVLYDPHGKLLFKGGITGSRGHDGDNDGESAVAALVNGQAASFTQTPVYGCSLLGNCQSSPSEPIK